MGLDTITWECDYPHSDTTWPHAPERLEKAFAGVPDADVNQITHENAMRHFQFDPFSKLERGSCTVGALRAQAQASGVDTSHRSAGGKPAAPEDAPFVTIGHIMKQLASAFRDPLRQRGRRCGRCRTLRGEAALGPQLRSGYGPIPTESTSIAAFTSSPEEEGP